MIVPFPQAFHPAIKIKLSHVQNLLKLSFFFFTNLPAGLEREHLGEAWSNIPALILHCKLTFLALIDHNSGVLQSFLL